MTDPFTFNPIHIRVDEELGLNQSMRAGGGGVGNPFPPKKRVWWYPLPDGSRLECASPEPVGGGGGGGGSWSAHAQYYGVRTGLLPDFLQDLRLLSLQYQHAKWVEGLSAHRRLAILAQTQKEGGV